MERWEKRGEKEKEERKGKEDGWREEKRSFCGSGECGRESYRGGRGEGEGGGYMCKRVMREWGGQGKKGVRRRGLEVAGRGARRGGRGVGGGGGEMRRTEGERREFERWKEEYC